MQFYEPGPYEEFVGKISTAKAKPSDAVWSNVSQRLDEIQRRKKIRLLYFVSGYAATFLLIGGLTFLFFNNADNQDFKNYPLADIHELKIKSLPSHGVNISGIKRPSPLPINFVRRKVESQSPIDVVRTVDLANRLEPINSVKGVHLMHNEHVENSSALRPVKKNRSNENPTEKHNLHTPLRGRGWTLAIYSNPYFSSNTSIINHQLGITKEMGLWMWGGEVQLTKRITENIGLVFGLAVTPTGQKSSDILMYNQGSVSRNKELLSAVTNYGMVSVSTLHLEKPMQSNGAKSSPVSLSDLSQQIYHIEVPFMFTTNFKVDRVGVEFRIGGAAGMLIHNKFEVQNEFGDFVGQTQGVKPYSVSAISAVNVSVPIVNRLSLVVEPYFRLGLVSFSGQANTATYPFNASVRLGLGYSF